MSHELDRIHAEYAVDRDIDRFVAALERMVASGQDFYMVYQALGNGYMNQRKPAEAAAAFAKAAELFDGNWLTFYQLGAALAQLGRYAEAVEAYKAAIRLEPGDSRPFANMGNSLLQLGRHAEAIDAFEAALRIDPNDQVAKHNLAAVKSFLAGSTNSVSVPKKPWWRFW